MQAGKNRVFAPTRREVLKFSGATAAFGLGTPYISRAWAGAPTEVSMLAWYGHAEPDIVEEFETRHNVRFKPVYYTGGDNMLDLIAESPPGTYDIILSDAEFVPQLNDAGYVEEMNPADYPFDDFFEEFRHFPGLWKGGKLYSAMVRFGYLGISFNTTKVSREEAMDYAVLWDPKVKGKVGHFDWHLPNLGCLSLYNGNNDPDPFDIDETAWKKLQETTMSLKPQVGGYFDRGGTLSSLKDGKIWAMCGIGDWITGVLIKDGAPVDSVVPKQGGIQWTESYSIAKGSDKHDICRQFIQYMLSPEGQVRSAKMQAYPGLLPTRSGWKALMEQDPGEATRQNMKLEGPNVMDLIRDGKIHYRALPKQQSLEDWSDFWSEYKNV